MQVLEIEIVRHSVQKQGVIRLGEKCSSATKLLVRLESEIALQYFYCSLKINTKKSWAIAVRWEFCS
jgi:hypothetical protein